MTVYDGACRSLEESCTDFLLAQHRYRGQPEEGEQLQLAQEATQRHATRVVEAFNEVKAVAGEAQAWEKNAWGARAGKAPAEDARAEVAQLDPYDYDSGAWVDLVHFQIARNAKEAAIARMENDLPQTLQALNECTRKTPLQHDEQYALLTAVMEEVGRFYDKRPGSSSLTDPQATAAQESVPPKREPLEKLQSGTRPFKEAPRLSTAELGEYALGHRLKHGHCVEQAIVTSALIRRNPELACAVKHLHLARCDGEQHALLIVSFDADVSEARHREGMGMKHLSIVQAAEAETTLGTAERAGVWAVDPHHRIVARFGRDYAGALDRTHKDNETRGTYGGSQHEADSIKAATLVLERIEPIISLQTVRTHDQLQRQVSRPQSRSEDRPRSTDIDASAVPPRRHGIPGL